MKLHRTVVLVLLSVILACSSKDLSRSKAKNLIAADKRFADPVSSLSVVDCAAVAKAAAKDGIVTITAHTTPSMFGGPITRTSIDLTAEGRKYFKKVECSGFAVPSLELVTPLRRSVVEITGIADAAGPGGGTSAGTRDVGFTWRFVDVPEVVARYTKADTVRKTQATLRLYDDGWRVESLWNGDWFGQ